MMPDDFIQQSARLMREQASGYRQLNSATEGLIAALGGITMSRGRQL